MTQRRFRIRDRIRNRIGELERKAVYGAVSLGTIIGFVVVLIVKGCL